MVLLYSEPAIVCQAVILYSLLTETRGVFLLSLAGSPHHTLLLSLLTGKITIPYRSMNWYVERSKVANGGIYYAFVSAPCDALQLLLRSTVTVTRGITTARELELAIRQPLFPVLTDCATQ